MSEHKLKLTGLTGWREDRLLPHLWGI